MIVAASLFVFGSISGPTHLGPAFGIPTVNFDLPWSLGIISDILQIYLFRPIYDKNNMNLSVLKHFSYAPNLKTDVEEELKIQQEGYRLGHNTPDQLINAFYEMVVRVLEIGKKIS